MLSIRVVGELGRTRRYGTRKDELLQVVEQGRVVLGEERDGDAVLARATGTTDPVRVI
jgi:hypothetical protein